MKILKILGIVLLVAMIGIVATCSYISKDLPESTEGPKAEALADQMWSNLNKAAWDSTRYVSWSFRGEHHYKWDKEANLAEISWDDNRVLLNLDKVEGVAFVNGQKIKDENSLVQTAWSFWCNDMYWLIAPFKIRDIGTALSKTEDNKLVVTYESGGVTPGDSYVWMLDENGRPLSYEMHVSIIPIKGVEATWEDWQQLNTGAWVSTEHIISGIGALSLKPLKGGMSLQDIGLEEDIWAAIRD